MFNYEGFEILVKDSGLKKQYLAVLLGKKSSIFNDWKAGKSEPKKEYLEILAHELGTSVEFLLGESRDPFGILKKEKSSTPEGVELDAETIQLKEIWNSADQEERDALLAMAKMLKARRNK